jgi:hypothetical protein
LITYESKKLAALAILLRIYGVPTLIIFGSLFVGFAVPLSSNSASVLG